MSSLNTPTSNTGFYLHLEISDFEALANIRRLEVLKMLVNGPKDVKSIANALKISTQAANRHLRILYRSGFIERKATIRNDTYKLHYIYYISPKGVEILKSIKPQQPSKYANT